jgi:hypothetical protein
MTNILIILFLSAFTSCSRPMGPPPINPVQLPTVKPPTNK